MNLGDSMELKAPFPFFGGKRLVADIVWQAFGNVDLYVEPFAGSLAVLLGREHPSGREIVNDIDRMLVNFWRALQHDPAGVAHYANSPANEADLTAKHLWLVNTGAERIARLEGDPDYYDVQVAGWWVWGLCCWIGGGWCKGEGPWTVEDGKLAHLQGDGPGVKRQRAHVSHGQGINRKRVHLSSTQGISRRLVHLGRGEGINRKLIHLGHSGRGTATGEAEIADYLSILAERLRYVRVCCGDWKRVVTPGALSHGNRVGIFLDPPYDIDLRDRGVYNTDKKSGKISAEVRAWCLENGSNPRYRIVLCGYEGEHEMPDDWAVIPWVAGRSYGRASGATANSENREKERLWLSPYCLKTNRQLQISLFD